MTHHQKSPEDVHCIHCNNKNWEELAHSDWFKPRAWQNTWVCGTCGKGLVHLKVYTTDELHKIINPLERKLTKVKALNPHTDEDNTPKHSDYDLYYKEK
jgi:hypothetical protein